MVLIWQIDVYSWKERDEDGKNGRASEAGGNCAGEELRGEKGGGQTLKSKGMKAIGRGRDGEKTPPVLRGYCVVPIVTQKPNLPLCTFLLENKMKFFVSILRLMSCCDS